MRARDRQGRTTPRKGSRRVSGRGFHRDGIAWLEDRTVGARRGSCWWRESEPKAKTLYPCHWKRPNPLCTFPDLVVGYLESFTFPFSFGQEEGRGSITGLDPMPDEAGAGVLGLASLQGPRLPKPDPALRARDPSRTPAPSRPRRLSSERSTRLPAKINGRRKFPKLSVLRFRPRRAQGSPPPPRPALLGSLGPMMRCRGWKGVGTGDLRGTPPMSSFRVETPVLTGVTAPSAFYFCSQGTKFYINFTVLSPSSRILGLDPGRDGGGREVPVTFPISLQAESPRGVWAKTLTVRPSSTGHQGGHTGLLDRHPSLHHTSPSRPSPVPTRHGPKTGPSLCGRTPAAQL